MSTRRHALLSGLAVVAVTALIDPSMALASSVTNASFQSESPATGATYLVDEVGFTTASALSESNGDSVTIEAPSGTTFDTTPDDTSIVFYINGEINYVLNASTNGSTITVPVPDNVPAGAQVYIDLQGTGNPTSDGPGTWSIYTSTDTTPVPAGSQTFAPSSVSDVSINVSPTSANATASYYATFTLTNPLMAADWQGTSMGTDFSQITFTAPPGTTFDASSNCPGAGGAFLTDENNSNNDQELPCVSISDAGNAITLSVPDANIPAGHTVSIEIDGVNPNATGEQPVSVSTSSDPTPVNEDVDLTPDTAVTNTSLQTESSAVNASQLVDEVGFKATTALSESSESAVTINAPSGVSLRADANDIAFYDATTGTSVQSVTNAFNTNNDPNSLTLFVPFDVAAGDQIYVELEQVTNPSSSGSGQWSVDTSSDLTPVDAGSPQTFADSSVSGFSVSASSLTAGATGVTYTADFTTASPLRAYDWQNTQMDSGETSEISFTAPTDASFANACPSAQLTDFTHPADSQTLSCSATSDNQITLMVNSDIPAGDAVSVAIGGVTNPTTVTGQPVSLDTSSDPDSVSATVPGVIISEFRLTSDPYIDLANISSSPISLTGWTLELADTSSDSTSIPLSGTIPPDGHLLIANTNYASDPLASLASADITYSFGSVLDDGGIRLLDSSSDLMDAVGFGAAPTGYYTGAALQFPASPPSGVEYAWTRNFSDGMPSDTGDNNTDFSYIAESDAGNSTYGSPVLGTPGPLDSDSPVVHTDILQSTLMDTSASATATPNFSYTKPSGTMSPSNPGTLLISRAVFNCAGQPTTPDSSCANAASGTTDANVTRLQFRVTQLTTQGSPISSSPQAILVPESSSGGSYDGYSLQPLTLAGGASTGGLNSVWQDPSVTSGSPLAYGSSINVQFAFKVYQSGSFSFAYNAEDDLDPIKGAASSDDATPSAASTPAPAETIVDGTITPTGKVTITSIRKGQRAALCTTSKRRTKKHGKKRRPRCVLAHIAARPHKKRHRVKESRRMHLAISRYEANSQFERPVRETSRY